MADQGRHATTPPASPHGDLKCIDLWSADDTRLEIICFDLSRCGIILCGSCTDIINVGGYTLKEAGDCIVRHWSRREAHPPGVSPSEFMDFALPQFAGNKDAIIPSRGVVLYESLFTWSPLLKLYEEAAKETRKFCAHCLFQKKQVRPCCGNASTVELNAYVKPKYTPIPVLPDSSLTEFYTSYPRTQQGPLALVPSPSLPSVPPLVHSTTASPPPCTVQKRVRFEDTIVSPVVGRERFYASEGASHGLTLGQETNMVDAVPFPLSVHSFAHPLLNPDTPLTAKRAGQLALETQPILGKELNKSNMIQLRLFGYPGGFPPLARQQEHAADSAVIDPGDPMDQALTQASLIFLRIGLLISHKTQSDAKALINKTMFDPHNTRVVGARDQDPIVGLSSGFPVAMDASSARRYAVFLARFLRVTIKKKLPLADELNGALLNVLGDVRNQSSRPEDWTMGELPVTIALALLGLVQKTGTSTLHQYLQAFLFQSKGARSSPGTSEEEEEGSDAGEEEDVAPVADSDGSLSNNMPTLASTNSLLKLLSAMILHFKLAVLIELDRRRIEYEKVTRDAISLSRPIQLREPLDEVAEFLKGACANAVWSAQTMHTLRATAGPSSASVLNAVTLEHSATNELLISTGQEQLYGEDFVVGSEILRGLGKE